MFIAKFCAGFLCLCFLFTKSVCKVGQPCNSTTAVDDACPTTELCDDATQTCQCRPDYINELGMCTTASYASLVENQGDGSLIAGILIPLFLIVFVICSVYVGKRFELVKWLRERFGHHNRNYDEFMIGHDDDDDPPLA